jgi:hypothetical protein
MLHHRAAATATSVVGVLLLLGACAGTGSGTAASPARPASSYGAALACTPAARTVCIAPSADGQTVTLTVGWTVDVDLRASNSVWSGLSEVGADLLHRIGALRHDAGAVSASYRAVEPGRTALRAFERPRCTPTRACPQFILLWQVNIRVRGQ